MSQQTLIALVDCNNFYVSCERVFRPDLWYKPVVVLSNNDGCIVSRSQEVKALGIKMATPVHQVQYLINQYHIQLFSSNYALYADMSHRVMQCLEAFTPRLEIYSIDESFLDLTGIYQQDLIAYGQKIKETMKRSTGIPVCVGMGSTKTLAKLANYAAKKWKKNEGVLDFSDPLERHKLMPLIPVGEVWGIGRQTTKKLQAMGINTAYDLATQAAETIRAHFNVVTARTVLELNGITCLEFEDIAPDKQQIVCSRSFKHRLTEYQQLSAALTSFCSRAAEKLRKQKSVTGSISIFIGTNAYNTSEPQYQRTIHSQLKQATSDTRQIMTIAKQLLKNIFKSGYRYQKCSVQLGHIRPETLASQTDLFDLSTPAIIQNSKKLMSAIDNINQRFPKGIALSANNINTNWQTPVEYLSPRYTTNWKELVHVKCN